MPSHLAARSTPRSPIRVLLWDSVAVRRAAVREFLEQDGQIVVGEIGDAIDYKMLRAEHVKPDIVITAAADRADPPGADLRRLADGAAVLVLCDCDERRAVAEGAVELPRSTSLTQLRDEVISAARTLAARTVPLLNRPSRRA